VYCEENRRGDMIISMEALFMLCGTDTAYHILACICNQIGLLFFFFFLPTLKLREKVRNIVIGRRNTKRETD